MRSHTKPIDRNLGPLVTIIVGPCWQQNALRRVSGEPFPQPIQVSALLDTGAGLSLIDKSILHLIDSHPVGKATLYTSHPDTQGHEAPVHEVHLNIVLDQNGSMDLGDVQVGEGYVGEQQLRAILGRNIMDRFRFIYDGIKGIYTLEFLPPPAQ